MRGAVWPGAAPLCSPQLWRLFSENNYRTAKAWKLTPMKRLSRRNLLLFSLPFILLAVVAQRSSGTLRLQKDSALFAQEVAREIPVGTPEAQAEQLFKSNGFSKILMLPSPSQAGQPRPVAPKRVRFIKTQTAFLRLLPLHAWEVSVTVQNNRVREVQGGYY